MKNQPPMWSVAHHVKARKSLKGRRMRKLPKVEDFAKLEKEAKRAMTIVKDDLGVG